MAILKHGTFDQRQLLAEGGTSRFRKRWRRRVGGDMPFLIGSGDALRPWPVVPLGQTTRSLRHIGYPVAHQHPGEQSLTPREMDILWGIAKGFTYDELAQRLEVSKQAVPVHIKNTYRKLQTNNRSEAVYVASRRGVIRL